MLLCVTFIATINRCNLTETLWLLFGTVQVFYLFNKSVNPQDDLFAEEKPEEDEEEEEDKKEPSKEGISPRFSDISASLEFSNHLTLLIN